MLIIDHHTVISSSTVCGDRERERRGRREQLLVQPPGFAVVQWSLNMDTEKTSCQVEVMGGGGAGDIYLIRTEPEPGTRTSPVLTFPVLCDCSDKQ